MALPVGNHHPSLPILASTLLDTVMPVLTRATPDYVTVDASSTSTKKEMPPLVFFPLDLATLRDVLDKPEVLAQSTQNVDRVMVENSHKITVEADVERASHLYLLHGVNQILQRYLLLRCPGDSFTCSSQVTKKKSRVDIVWRVADRIVLVMEMKNWGALAVGDWENAVVTGDSQDEKDANMDKKLLFAESTEQKTAARRNAAVILKQATKYVTSYNVPIVLVCDWGKMIYLDMKPGGEQWNNDGNFPHFFLVDEGALGAELEPLTFRRVLLAAFLVAMGKLGM
ncbi:hypothetical protein DFH09DRAFT_281514 [Mycena vulgaris]|nr:hypothetical protein DFH09DRAFT_281514 [Mycena vulgaris]